MPRPTLLTPTPGPRRQAAALLLTLAVLAGHLAGLGAAPEPEPRPAPLPVLQLRLLETGAAGPLPGPSGPTGSAPTRPAPPPLIRPRAAVTTAPALPAAPGPASTPQASEQASGAADPPAPWPAYRVVLPPAATRHYQLQRGSRSSPVRLSWAPQAQGYELSLMAEGGDLDGLGAASRGHVGPTGLVPERHVERRRGRDQRATNFDLASGQVRGSGGGQPHPWPAGGQDRLSWLVQLAAVLQADATLARPGAHIVLAVAGPRGPPATWLFQVRGPETVTLGNGHDTPGLALRRAAQHPYDLQVDVWLDPADHHLPLRLRMAAPPGDWESVWLLQPTP